MQTTDGRKIDMKEVLTYAKMNHGQRQWYLKGKYARDKALSVLALILLSPLIILITVVVFIGDPKANPFYSQIRVGEDGRRFRLYKFRTMDPGAEDEIDNLLPRNEMHGPVFKIKDDARITCIGKLLRKTGLDEIPQFINVLKGDMSIVGPRPPLPREVQLYTEEQKRRLKARPGITCLWQIRPNRNKILFDDWVALDLKYINERSHKLDRWIMRQTIIAMLRCQGE